MVAYKFSSAIAMQGQIVCPCTWLLHFFVFAFNRVISRAGAATGGFLLRCAVFSPRRGTSLLVDLRGDLVEGLLQTFTSRLDAGCILGSERRANVGNFGLQLALLVASELVAQLSDALLRAIGRAIGQVALLDLLFALLVVAGVRLGVAHHLVDLILREATGGHDRDLLLAPGALIFGRDIHNAVGVDIEGHFDLWNATGSGRNAIQDKRAQRAVVFGKLALTLQNVDLHARLAVAGRREDLAFLRWDGRIALDQAGEHAAQRLDTQRERGHVEQEHVLHVAGQHACLNGSADGHHLVRVHTTVRLAIKDALDQRQHRWHAGLAANQHDLVDIARAGAGIGERFAHGYAPLLDPVLNQLLQLGARQRDIQAFGASGLRRDKGRVDFCLYR